MSEEDGSTNLRKNYCNMEKDGTLYIVEQTMCMDEQEEERLIDNAYSLHMTGRLEYNRDFRPISGGGHITFGKMQMELLGVTMY